MANPPVSRASLLAGLRTGGVRTASGPAPHTAAPGASFNINPPSFIGSRQSVFPEEGEQVIQVPQNLNSFANEHHGGNRLLPMTAAVDGPNNRFAQQQRTNNATPSFVPPFNQANLNPLQAQAFQLQMMQLELMKIQAQNYQAEVLAQAQRQAQQPAHPQLSANGRQGALYNPPATAGPTASGFDLRSATLSAQMRRANQAEQLKSQEDAIPMTAALGGKFGSRTLSANGLPMKYGEDTPLPVTPNTTTVISGGTPLGSPAPNNLQFNNNPPTLSKSDAASSWRRGGNSVLNGSRSFTSPSVKVTPPPPELKTEAPLLSGISVASTPSTATPGTAKFRPQPLRFSAAVSQPLPVVAIDSDVQDIEEDGSSSSSSKSNRSGSPTTPPSSNEMPLSPREEASRKLYEGLGIGRPASNNGVNQPTVIVTEPGAVAAFSISSSYPASATPSYRLVSHPLRQPRGPPSGLEDLAPRNFATRMKLQAMDGLGVMRSGVVEAY